jgi:NAD-dependent deacetylase
MNDQQLTKAVQHLLAAKATFILTGAGVSKESGIPTYREPQIGLWAQYDPEVLGTPDGFRANPKLVWEWNEFRRNLMLRSEPNPGHYALAELQQLLPDVAIVTQNIDGLHQRAGCADVIELHGTVHRQKCFENCQGSPTLVSLDEVQQYSPDGVPLCPRCGGYIRPAITWFGEQLAEDVIRRAFDLAGQADVMISIGTSGVVWPAAGLPGVAKQGNNAYLIDVNPMPDLHLAGKSGEVLPTLVQKIREAKG